MEKYVQIYFKLKNLSLSLYVLFNNIYLMLSELALAVPVAGNSSGVCSQPKFLALIYGTKQTTGFHLMLFDQMVKWNRE